MLAVSATYPESLANALTMYMREPTFVRLNPTDPSLIGESCLLIVLSIDCEQCTGTKACLHNFQILSVFLPFKNLRKNLLYKILFGECVCI